MKKFSKFTQIDEISTGKLTDYVAKASMDVGRRIEKAEPGVKPMKKILDRSGKIGRAKAHIQIKANESSDMCNVCGQTPCNCTSIDEGTVQDKIDKVAKIYNTHRSLASKARQVGLGKKRDPEAEAHHMKKSHKAFDLMQKLRKGSSEASKSNPKPRPKEVDHSAAIAQDYKDQEAKRGIGHVRDHVEMDGNPVNEISQDLKNRYVERAVTAHGGYNMARRNTTGKVREYFARKEANTKKGISRALAKEEVEQVDELKKSTLASYIEKSTQDDGDSRGRTVKAGREQGVTKAAYRTQGLAHKKGTDGFRKYRAEEVEQVDELNISTVKSYLKKAKKAEVTHDANATKLLRASKKAFYKKDAEELYAKAADQQGRSSSRSRGIPMAQARLAKEEIEQVDELKVGTLLRYNTKAIKSSTKHGGEAGKAIDAGDRETAAKHFAKRDSRDAGARRALAKILAKKKTV